MDFQQQMMIQGMQSSAAGGGRGEGTYNGAASHIFTMLTGAKLRKMEGAKDVDYILGQKLGGIDFFASSKPGPIKKGWQNLTAGIWDAGKDFKPQPATVIEAPSWVGRTSGGGGGGMSVG